jgi:hypothetical protein
MYLQGRLLDAHWRQLLGQGQPPFIHGFPRRMTPGYELKSLVFWEANPPVR